MFLAVVLLSGLSLSLALSTGKGPRGLVAASCPFSQKQGRQIFYSVCRIEGGATVRSSLPDDQEN